MEHACDSCNAARACALGLLELLGCCNHSGMAPLGDPEKAALRAWLQEKRQDRNCKTHPGRTGLRRGGAPARAPAQLCRLRTVGERSVLALSGWHVW